MLNSQVGNQIFSTNIAFLVHEQRFSEAFHRPHKFGVDIDYGLSPLMEVFGGVSYTNAQAKRFTALDVTFTGTVGGTVIVAGSQFLGEFHDYEEYAGTLGLRRFFDRTSRFKPYVAAQVSARYVPGIDLRLFNEATGVQVDDIRFYDPTYTYSAGLRVGMRFDVTDYAAIGLETGVTYFGSLRDADASFSGLNEFDDSNNDSDRFELPLTVRAVIRF